MLLTRTYWRRQPVVNIPRCVRSLDFGSITKCRQLSQGVESQSGIVTLRSRYSLKQASSKDAIRAVENYYHSSGGFLRISLMMEKESDHEDKELVTSYDQLRKREREKGALGEASPPTKKRVRESDGEECELSQYSKDKRQDIVEDDGRCEAVASELSEDEFAKPLSLCDQVGKPLTLRTDSVDSLDESIQSTENLSSCDVSLGLNETECESLESSLVCIGNSLEDIPGDILDEEKEIGKTEAEVGVFADDDHAPKTKKKKKQKWKMKKADQENGESKKSTNTRPNYFVGVQVSDSEIHKNLIKVQEELLAYEPALCKALVDVATSHITLLIARLDDENALSVACSALEDYSKDSKIIEEPILLTFSGVDNFSNNVLYARVIEDEHHQKLLDVADSLRKVFTEKGVFMPNMKPLNPHLTIAKMSKAPRGGRGKPGLRKIEPLSYAKYKNIHFGCQPVKSLQLLAMNHAKDENRYYYCCKEIYFGKDVYQKSDHMQCCFPRRPVVSSQRRRSFSTTASENPTTASENPTTASENPTTASENPTTASENPFNIVASSVGFLTAIAASLMIVYVVGKVSGRV